MATAFLDGIVVILWPLVLLAAPWVIATYALAEKDEISEVVEALTRPKDVAESAKLGGLSLRCTPHTARNISTAKGRAANQTLLRDDDRPGDRAAVARMLPGHELLEYASL